MKELQGIKLGNVVLDVVSGMYGTVTSITESRAGFIQCGVQPKGDGSNMPDGWNIDPGQLEVTDEGLAPNVPDHLEYPDFEFGAVVKEKDSNFQGTVIGKNWLLNGCVTINILAPECNPQTGVPVNAWIHANNLELVKPNKNPEPRDSKRGPAPSRMQRNIR